MTTTSQLQRGFQKELKKSQAARRLSAGVVHTDNMERNAVSKATSIAIKAGLVILPMAAGLLIPNQKRPNRFDMARQNI